MRVVKQGNKPIPQPPGPVAVTAKPEVKPELPAEIIQVQESNTIIPSESEPERYQRFLEERRRVSMSVPQMKMSVPDIPGYHSHWFNDEQGHIERGLRAGYQFVEADEVSLHDFSLAGDSTKTGNQDMGTRVSMVVGTKEGGIPMKAYLMKIPLEIWKIDQKLQQERNDLISASMKAGRLGASQTGPADLANTYVKTSQVTHTTQHSPVPFGQKAEI